MSVKGFHLPFCDTHLSRDDRELLAGTPETAQSTQGLSLSISEQTEGAPEARQLGDLAGQANRVRAPAARQRIDQPAHDAVNWNPQRPIVITRAAEWSRQHKGLVTHSQHFCTPMRGGQQTWLSCHCLALASLSVRLLGWLRNPGRGGGAAQPSPHGASAPRDCYRTGRRGLQRPIRDLEASVALERRAASGRTGALLPRRCLHHLSDTAPVRPGRARGPPARCAGLWRHRVLGQADWPAARLTARPRAIHI
jgi:hypothetical protein